ncbi:hypothetical protein Tco_0695158 [Tanacetum coccineum]
MSAMANTTPIVTTVTKLTTKKKTPKEVDAIPRVNILDFCEEHYKDILPVIMDNIRRDKRKEVHVRLDLEESPKKRRIREGSQNSSVRTLSAMYRNPSERLKVRDLLKYNKRHVLDRLGHRRQSAFDRLSDTYSPSTTKSGPDRPNSRDRSHSRSHPRRRDSSNKYHPRSRDHSCGVKESYDNTRSSYGIRTKRGYRLRDKYHPYYEKKGRESKSPSSRVSESGTSDGGTGSQGASRVWFDELPSERIDGYKDLKAAFLAYFMPQKKYVKDPGAPECIRIYGFMHGVNNPELTKRLNKHVPKTMEEMMITTTAFIQGQSAATGKKKVKKADKELVRAGKLSHLIKEIKKGRDQPKVGKREALAKDKSMEIYMIQPWHRMTRQKVTQSFERVSEITFPSLITSIGTEGPLVIEAEIGGHMIHRISFYKSMDELRDRKFPVDGGIVTIRRTILIQAECVMVITSSKEIPKEARVRHENFKVALHPNFPDQEVAIGGTLSAKEQTTLCSLLKKNLDISHGNRQT